MKFIQTYNLKDASQGYLWTLIVPQVIVIIFAAIVSKICADLNMTDAEIQSSTVIIVVSLIISQLCFAGVYLIFSRVKRVNFINASRFKFKFNIWYLLISIAISVGLLFGMSQFMSLYDYGVSFIAKQGSALSLKMDNFGMFVVGIVLYALLPAVIEESLFRGLIFNGLRSKFKPKTAIVIASIMFMIVHMSIHQTIYQFLLGATLCLIVYFTGSVFYSIIAHFINNFFIVLVTYIQVSKGTFVEYITDWPAWKIVEAVVLAIVTVSLIITIFVMWKKFFPPKAQDVVQEETVDNKIKKNEGLGEYEVRAMNPAVISPMGWMWISLGVGVALWVFSVFF